MCFGVSKYFPIFFIRQNIAEGPFESNSILKECLGNPLLGTPRGAFAPPRTGQHLGEADVDVSGDLLHQDGCPLQGAQVNLDGLNTTEEFCQHLKSKPESKKVTPTLPPRSGEVTAG